MSTHQSVIPFILSLSKDGPTCRHYLLRLLAVTELVSVVGETYMKLTESSRATVCDSARLSAVMRSAESGAVSITMTTGKNDELLAFVSC